MNEGRQCEKREDREKGVHRHSKRPKERMTDRGLDR